MEVNMENTFKSFDEANEACRLFLSEVLLNFTKKMVVKHDSVFVVDYVVKGRYGVTANLQTGEWDVDDEQPIVAKGKISLSMTLVDDESFTVFTSRGQTLKITSPVKAKDLLMAIAKLSKETKFSVHAVDVTSSRQKLIVTQEIIGY
jgi:hypothetical protein